MKTTKLILFFAVFFIGSTINSYGQKSLLELKEKEIVEKYLNMERTYDEDILKLFEEYYKEYKSKILEPDTIYLIEKSHPELINIRYGILFSKKIKIEYIKDKEVMFKEHSFFDELFPLVFTWDIDQIVELGKKYPMISPTTTTVRRIIINDGVQLDVLDFNSYGLISLLGQKGREIIEKYAKMKTESDEDVRELFEIYYNEYRTRILEPDTIYLISKTAIDMSVCKGAIFNTQIKIDFTKYCGEEEKLSFEEHSSFDKLLSFISEWNIDKIRELEEKYSVISPTTIYAKRIIIHNGVKIDSFIFDQFGSFDE